MSVNNPRKVFILFQNAGQLSTVQEFSRTLGRPFYSFNCTHTMDHVMLTDIFKGLANTGEMSGNLKLH